MRQVGSRRTLTRIPRDYVTASVPLLERGATVSHDAHGTSAKRILIVDDEPHIRRLLAERLTADGFEVAEADNGEECLELIGDFLPDLVLLDLMMPGADGLEVLSRIRTEPKHAAIPVIILTAKGQDTDRELAFAGGAADFVTKPFSPMKLLARIREIVGAT
jgi:DNA-binding response OmpR family regulator